jgi:hypothetical protein
MEFIKVLEAFVMATLLVQSEYLDHDSETLEHLQNSSTLPSTFSLLGLAIMILFH